MPSQSQTQSQSQSQNRNGGGRSRRGSGGSGSSLQSLFESPLFREVLANALVAAAGAAAATLIRKNPDSAKRVANVAAAATAMTATSSTRELTDAGREAVRELATRVGREVVPGFMSAVLGNNSDGEEQDRPARRSSGKSKAEADSWR